MHHLSYSAACVPVLINLCLLGDNFWQGPREQAEPKGRSLRGQKPCGLQTFVHARLGCGLLTTPEATPRDLECPRISVRKSARVWRAPRLVGCKRPFNGWPISCRCCVDCDDQRRAKRAAKVAAQHGFAGVYTCMHACDASIFTYLIPLPFTDSQQIQGWPSRLLVVADAQIIRTSLVQHSSGKVRLPCQAQLFWYVRARFLCKKAAIWHHEDQGAASTPQRSAPSSQNTRDSTATASLFYCCCNFFWRGDCY
eukprot:scaffold13922_cov15-Tisochrysis_lutea.AAC.4